VFAFPCANTVVFRYLLKRNKFFYKTNKTQLLLGEFSSRCKHSPAARVCTDLLSNSPNHISVCISLCKHSKCVLFVNWWLVVQWLISLHSYVWYLQIRNLKIVKRCLSASCDVTLFASLRFSLRWLAFSFERGLIAHFRYIKYSASLRGCETVKLNTKEISSYSLGSQCNFSCFSIPASDWS
jgi:hypothetical protein